MWYNMGTKQGTEETTLNNFSEIVPAKDMETVTATSATVRFQDFELRTYNAIENHARQGYGSCARLLDIPHGICVYNGNLSKFIKRLEEAGYAAVVARKCRKGSQRYLFIGWTADGIKKIEDIINSRDWSAFYYYGEGEE